MKISSAFPSKYIKASDLMDHEVTVTMSHVAMESIDIGEKETKPVLYFEGKKKGLVLNKTNSKTIATFYGDDTDSWNGEPLILFPAMVDFRGDQVEAVRVRVPKKPGVKQKAPEIIPASTPVTQDDLDAMDEPIPF